MLEVYQTKTVAEDGYGDCYAACVASILEVSIDEVPDVPPTDPELFDTVWRMFFADRGVKMKYFPLEKAPLGYSIASIYTDRVYPEGHRKSGERIPHGVVAYNGIICHDPHPLGSSDIEIIIYSQFEAMGSVEVLLHKLSKDGGYCRHGYQSQCDEC
jgi:hypothetical protein